MQRNLKKCRYTRWGRGLQGPGCHGGCGVEVHVKDGRVIKVEEWTIIPGIKGDFAHGFSP